MSIIIVLMIICWNSVNCYNVINSYPQSRNIDDKLVSVIALTRHGDRSPSKSFPKDTFFNTSYWPMGFEQLTNQGKLRHYKLGQWLRSRYDSLISTEYSPNDIYIYSTDTDRSLMSAAANLAGLYPPVANQIWNSDLKWQPIPIHSSARKEDDIITVKRKCPRYKKLYDEVVDSTYYKRLNEQYSHLFAYISEHSGWKVKDIGKIKRLRSMLYCEENYNISYIPEWTKSLDKFTLDFLTGVAFQRYSRTVELKRLRTGPFFYYIFSHFDRVINSTEGAPKFLFISGHDTSLASALDAMGVYDLYPPNFGATLLWELRRNEEGAHFVHLFYRKDENILIELNIAECMIDCPYETFKSLMEPITVDISDWILECAESERSDFKNIIENSTQESSISDQENIGVN
ncbi:unnamed protein product [Phaedon cochleariae]|uniref:acid phosphatase n=1 Tax=Phaedon cochleariae TaxID=80249 RepID=A0A9P0GN08_PHACE|nr:unnamed protein product [Phaedon cochleariae]